MSEIPSWFVVCMGLGTVFVGLICIIIICKIMSVFLKERKTVTLAEKKPTEIENREELIAAVSAAVAEDMGTDISAIRILSFKKI